MTKEAESADFTVSEVVIDDVIGLGIDMGTLHCVDLDGSVEYIGRVLNLSCRLQGSLKDPEHVNKILISVKSYKRIASPEIKSHCIERERIFRNISENNRTRCYELNTLSEWSNG